MTQNWASSGPISIAENGRNITQTGDNKKPRHKRGSPSIQKESQATISCLSRSCIFFISLFSGMLTSLNNNISPMRSEAPL